MKVSGAAPILVVSDLDHTMIGHERDPDDTLLGEFKDLWYGRLAFNGSHLVYSTGRNKKEALSVAVEKGLPRPTYLVCGVGTEVYAIPEDLPLSPGGEWAKDDSRINLLPHWQDRMVETFNRDAIEKLLSDKFPMFQIRGNVTDDPFRIPTSLEVNGDFEATLQAVREALGEQVQVIASGGGEWKLVDFCSAEAGKMKACEFARTKLGMAPEQTLVCGDSGNDESMYRAPNVCCVAVGNSLDELVSALQGMAKGGPDVVQRGSCFETKSGSMVFYANRFCAGGIVEALEHFWATNGDA